MNYFLIRCGACLRAKWHFRIFSTVSTNVTLNAEHWTQTSGLQLTANWNNDKHSATLFLVNDRRDVQFFSTYLFLFITLYVFRAHRVHHQERQIVSIQPLVAVGGRVVCRSEVNFVPANDTATDTQWQLPEVVLTQFVSPDDEHDVLETCRELKIKTNT